MSVDVVIIFALSQREQVIRLSVRVVRRIQLTYQGVGVIMYKWYE